MIRLLSPCERLVFGRRRRTRRPWIIMLAFRLARPSSRIAVSRVLSTSARPVDFHHEDKFFYEEEHRKLEALKKRMPTLDEANEKQRLAHILDKAVATDGSQGVRPEIRDVSSVAYILASPQRVMGNV